MGETVATAAQGDLVGERSSRDHESVRVCADSSFTMEERVATAAQGDLVGEIVS